MSEDMDLLADEYVLGLLDELAERRVEKRAGAEPDLAAALGRARDRFAALDLTAPLQPGAEALWPKIAARLVPPEAAVEVPAPAPVVARPSRRRFLPVGAGLAAGLLIGAVLGVQAFRADPVVIAVLLADDGTPQAVVEDFGNDNARVRFVADVAVPDGQVMEVWTLPSLEMGPVSLGLLEAARADTLRGPDLPAPLAGQLYEITIEQAGGSPTGRPTGPILAKGFAAPQI